MGGRTSPRGKFNSIAREFNPYRQEDGRHEFNPIAREFNSYRQEDGHREENSIRQREFNSAASKAVPT